MKSLKTEGIIIKRINLGETDRLLIIYTREHGKLKAIAKGVKKIKSKLAGSLEPYSPVMLQLHPGKTFYLVTGAVIVEERSNISNECSRFSEAHYFGELIDKLTHEGVPNEALYNLFAKSLGYLCQPTGAFLQPYFELKILDSLGFRPQLYKCVKCQSPLTPKNNQFDFGGGGVICPNCHQVGAKKISADAIKAMRVILQTDIKLIDRIIIEPSITSELIEILDLYQQQFVEQKLKSKNIFNSLKI